MKFACSLDWCRSNFVESWAVCTVFGGLERESKGLSNAPMTPRIGWAVQKVRWNWWYIDTWWHSSLDSTTIFTFLNALERPIWTLSNAPKNVKFGWPVAKVCEERHIVYSAYANWIVSDNSCAFFGIFGLLGRGFRGLLLGITDLDKVPMECEWHLQVVITIWCCVDLDEVHVMQANIYNDVIGKEPQRGPCEGGESLHRRVAEWTSTRSIRRRNTS